MVDYLGREIDWEKVWSHFNRMQKKIMYDITSRADFFAESESDRIEFYNWMQNQCGQYACYM